MHKGSKFPDHGSNLLALEEWSLNHWTTREVPRSLVKISLKMDMKVCKKKKKRNKNYEFIPWEGNQVCHSFPNTGEYDIGTHILRCLDIWNTRLFKVFKVLASQSKIKERNWFNTIEKMNRFKLELKSSIFNGEGLIAKVWFCSQAGHTDQAHFFCNLF